MHTSFHYSPVTRHKVWRKPVVDRMPGVKLVSHTPPKGYSYQNRHKVHKLSSALHLLEDVKLFQWKSA